jgi:WD40 repeat protein
LAHKLGEWPLLLRLAGAQLAEYVSLDGMTPADAMTAVTEQLDTYGYTAFDRADETARNSAISISLRVSLDRLGAGRKRFLELAVFPEDTDIPFASMIRLWGATGGLSRLEAENTIRAIQRLSLFVNYDPQHRHVRLHDVLRAIIVKQVGADLPSLHVRFLDSFGLSAWADLPTDEPYLWDHLFYHLRAAGRDAEAIGLAQDLRFAAARINARGNPVAGEVVFHPDSAVLGRIARIRIMLSRVAHLFPPPGNLTAIQHTVYARLANLIDLDGPLADFEPTLPRPYLAPDHPLPDQPHPMLLRTLTGHADKVRSVALFVGEETTLAASGSSDKTVRVWSPRDGALKYTLTGHDKDVYGLAFSPDGRRLASGAHDDLIKVWDTQQGREILTLAGHTDRVNGVAWSPDGGRIASAGWDSTVRLWDAQTGELIQTLEGHSDGVLCVAFSLDGNQVASGSADRSIRVWDVQSGECLHTLEGHTGWAFTLCYAANGDLITGGVDKTIRVWDATTKAEKHVIENAHRNWIRAVAYLHDNSGGEVVSGSDDRTVKVWSLATGQLVESLVAHADWVSALAAAPGMFVSGSEDTTVRIWDRVGVQTERTPPPQDIHANWVNAVVYTPDYTRVISAGSDRVLKVWDAATGQPIRTVEGHKHWVLSVAVSPDGRRFASASRDKSVRVWDSATGSPMIPPLAGHEDWVNDVIFPEANTVISAGDDRRIIIWDWQTSKPRLTISYPKGAVYALATYGEMLASVGSDQAVRVWNWRTGQPIRVMTGHTDLVDSVAFSPDGTQLVTSGNDKTIRLWEVATGRLIRTLSGHTGHVYGAAFSPDGRYIASTSLDATLRVWEAESGAEVAAFRADGPMLACTWHADGVRIVASGARGVYWLRLVR